MIKVRNRIVGFIVLAAAAIALAVTLWTSHERSSYAECQSQVNTVFLETLKARAVISDGDRDAIRKLVIGLVDAQTDDESNKVIQKYKADNERLDQLRKEFKYPDLTIC